MFRKLHHFFVPHSGNGHKPGYFSSGAVVAMLLFILGSFSLYLADIKLLATRDSLLAAILPTVLAYETNQERVRNNLGMVEMDNELNLAAQYKANDMAEKSYFAHVSPEGKTPWYWLDLSGYQYVYAGENLAANFEESNDVVNAWIASPTHHANLIKPQYTKMGIGIARGKLNGQDTMFVVQLFATPKSNPVADIARAVTPGAIAEASASAPVLPQVAQTTTAPLNTVNNQKIQLRKPVVIRENMPVPTTVTKAQIAKAHDDALLLASLEKERLLEAEKMQIKNEHRKKIVALISAQPATPSLLDEILASPRELITLLLVAILLLTMVLFVASMIAGMQLPHRDVIVGTLAISGCAAVLLLIVTTGEPTVLVPTDTQSASTVLAL